MKTYKDLTDKEKQIYEAAAYAADAEIDATNHLRAEGEWLNPETLPAHNAFHKIEEILLK